MRERLEARGRPTDPLDVMDCGSPEIVEGSHAASRVRAAFS
jgi:hypothetical protein